MFSGCNNVLLLRHYYCPAYRSSLHRRETRDLRPPQRSLPKFWTAQGVAFGYVLVNAQDGIGPDYSQSGPPFPVSALGMVGDWQFQGATLHLLGRVFDGQPDIQYVHQPSGQRGVADALVVGVRLRFSTP